MTEDNNFPFLLMLVITFLGGVLLSTFLIRRAIPQVIEIFYQQNALGINYAKTLRELGLERKDFLQRMIRPRDYKQYALKALIKTGVICVTHDERLYMVEGTLNQNFRRRGNHLRV